MTEVTQFIDEHNKFAIISHISPDGDTIGCALALYTALKDLGKSCTVHCKSKPTSYYDFIVNIDKYQPLTDIPEGAAIICVDCADLVRTGLDENHGYEILSIDHHISNTNFGDINYVRTASATAILVYEILAEMNIDFTSDIATMLYIGISTDTNNFTNSNVDGNTFRVAATLADLDVDINWVSKQLFRTRSFPKTKAIAKFIDQIELYCGGKLCLSFLSYEQIQELQLEDSEGLVNYASDLAGVDVAVFLKESKPEKCKFSLRSNSDIDVQKICSVFNGGGHTKAAGCIIEAPLKKAKEKMLTEVIKWMV